MFQSRSCTFVLHSIADSMVPVPQRTRPIAHAQSGVGARHFEVPR